MGFLPFGSSGEKDSEGFFEESEPDCSLIVKGLSRGLEMPYAARSALAREFVLRFHP